MSTTQEYFTSLNERAQAGEFASAAGYVFQFNIEGAGVWTIDLKDSNAVSEGPAENADCTISTTKEIFEAMTENPMVAMQAFMDGTLTSDNPMLAMQLQQFLG